MGINLISYNFFAQTEQNSCFLQILKNCVQNPKYHQCCFQGLKFKDKDKDLSLEDIAELVDCADDVLFNKALDNPYHVLHNSMPNETVSSYALRRRPHNRELVDKISRLVESSFIVRMLYTIIHSLLGGGLLFLFLILDCFYFAFCQRSFKRIYMRSKVKGQGHRVNKCIFAVIFGA